MMTRGRWLALLCGLLLVLPAAWAQTPPAQNNMPGDSSGSIQVFRTGANLALVDVVVMDRDKAVQGLRAQQFRIFENRKEQKVTVFEEHRAGDALQTGKVPELPPNVYSNYPQYALTSAANVLLLDALNTPVPDQAYMRQQMLEYLKQLPAGTRVAVFTLSSRLRMIAGFTTDAGELEAAIESRKGGPGSSVLLDDPQDRSMMTTLGKHTDLTAIHQFLADSESFHTDQRVGITLDAFQQLARYLGTIPGRKNLIWFSGSFPLGIGLDPSLFKKGGPHSKPTDPLSPVRDYEERVKQTADLLSEARVAVYPVDAGQLMGLASTDALGLSMDTDLKPASGGGASGGSVQPGSLAASERSTDQMIEGHATMDEIAKATGGLVFYNTNDLKGAVARAIENGANYYTIGYTPDAKDWDGSFRRITVQVAGGRYDLEYRRGYYADDPRKPAANQSGAVSPLAEALERGAPPQAQITFLGRALAAGDPAFANVKLADAPAGEMAKLLKPPVKRYLVDCAVDPRGLTWQVLPDRTVQAKMAFVVFVWDGEGKRVNYTERALAVNLNAEQQTRALANGVALDQEIDLPAGEMYVRVAMEDLPTGRIGSLEIPVNVPKK